MYTVKIVHSCANKNQLALLTQMIWNLKVFFLKSFYISEKNTIILTQLSIIA